METLKHNNVHRKNLLMMETLKHNVHRKNLLTFSHLKVEAHLDTFLCVRKSKPTELQQKFQKEFMSMGNFQHPKLGNQQTKSPKSLFWVCIRKESLSM